MSDQKTFNAIWCAAITALPRCKAVLVIIVYTPMRQMELKKSAELTLVMRWISAAVGGDFHSGFPNVGNILSRNSCEVNKSADTHCADNVAHAAPRKPYEGTSKKSPMTLSPAANAKIFNGVLLSNFPINAPCAQYEANTNGVAKARIRKYGAAVASKLSGVPTKSKISLAKQFNTIKDITPNATEKKSEIDTLLLILYSATSLPLLNFT